MRIAIVSSYPPRHCGIGSYAHAQAERLRAEGHAVTVISPPDGDGDARVAFSDGRVFREAERTGASYDRIIVHFQPGLYYRPGATAAVSKIRTSLALDSLVRRRPQTEILVHEAHRPTRWRPDHVVLRRAFGHANLRFHTNTERRAFERQYRMHTRAEIVDHRDGIRVHGPRDRRGSRKHLGLDRSEPLLLCAGFLHPWKGFDRAVRAFARSEGPGRLVIVGSVRDATSTNLAYAEELRELAERTSGVTLIERFQSDEDFDAWVSAADRLVLPYTRAWSSGALARARLLGTPSIVSAVGGLEEQVGPEDEVVRSDDELRAAFQRIRGSGRRDVATSRSPGVTPPRSSGPSRPS
ncbi:MAG: glycosyltransferase family 4 protein [Actinomycetota bacterium]